MIGLNRSEYNNLTTGSRDERTGESYLTTGIVMAAYSLSQVLSLLSYRE